MELKDKNKALADLLGITTTDSGIGFIYVTSAGEMNGKSFNPYLDTVNGLALFATILLKYPQVMWKTIYASFGVRPSIWVAIPPTQESILDEILKMEGKWIG